MVDIVLFLSGDVCYDVWRAGGGEE